MTNLRNRIKNKNGATCGTTPIPTDRPAMASDWQRSCFIVFNGLTHTQICNILNIIKFWLGTNMYFKWQHSTSDIC
jgi:hypothetical protein